MKFRQKHLRMKEKMCLEVTTTTKCTLVKLVNCWYECFVMQRWKVEQSLQLQDNLKKCAKPPLENRQVHLPVRAAIHDFLFALRDDSPTLCDPIDPPTFVCLFLVCLFVFGCLFLFVCLFVCFLRQTTPQMKENGDLNAGAW